MRIGNQGFRAGSMNKPLLLILLFALLLRIIAFSGYTGAYDDTKRSELLHQISEGSWPAYEGDELWVGFLTRTGFLGATTSVIKLLGFSEISLTLYPLVASILTVFLVYRLALRWVGRRGALYASFLFAVFPLDVLFATRIYEDSPLNFFCTLSVLLFVYAAENPSRRTAFLVSLLAGLAVGVAYLHKVSAGYLCVFFAAVGIADMLRSREILWRHAFLACGFLLVFLFDLWVNDRLNGDPFFHLHYYARQADILTARSGAILEWSGGLFGSLKRLFWTFPLGSLISLQLGFFYWFIFPAFFYCLLKRPSELALPLFWWALLAVLINLSSIQGARLPFYSRGTYLISVPGVLLVARLLEDTGRWTFLERTRSRKAALFIFVALAATGLVAAGASTVFREPVVGALAALFRLKTPLLDRASLEIVIGLFTAYLAMSAAACAVFFGLAASRAWVGERTGRERWLTQLLPVLAAGFLALSSVSFCLIGTRAFPSLEKEAFRALRELPPKVTYVDPRMKKFLDFLTAYREPERFVSFEGVDLASLRGAYLVYNRRARSLMIQLREPVAKYSTFVNYPDIEKSVKPDWRVASSLRGGEVVIYEVP
ncbi:MAG: glycosyltransferase family 39 protein [bacterium]